MDKPLILVADDDERLLFALSVRLEAQGFEIVRAVNGSDALELARKRPPELLILDVNMPGFDGFSLVEKMDEIPGLSGIPVIYITGADGHDAMVAASERLGAIVLMGKPFEIEELLENISLVVTPPQPTG